MENRAGLLEASVQQLDDASERSPGAGRCGPQPLRTIECKETQDIQLSNRLPEVSLVDPGNV